MAKFQYDKLIRDKISDLALQDGAQLDFSLISGQEKIDALKKKIIEESAEIIGAKTNKDLLDELVDLSTVIKSLLSCLSVSQEQFAELEAEKIEKRGGFEKGVYANSMTVNEDHPRYEYFRNNPEKYPEIE